MLSNTAAVEATLSLYDELCAGNAPKPRQPGL